MTSVCPFICYPCPAAHFPAVVFFFSFLPDYGHSFLSVVAVFTANAVILPFGDYTVAVTFTFVPPNLTSPALLLEHLKNPNKPPLVFLASPTEELA